MPKTLQPEPDPAGGAIPSRSEAPRHLVTALMVFAAVVTASSLRPGSTSVGPLLPEITEGLGINATTAGVLTALPGFTFAVVGLAANQLTTLTGVVGSLLLSSLVSTVGLFLRVLTDSPTIFLVLSALALSGMAVGNVVLPAFIKAEFPRKAAQMATAYTTFLSAGATIPILVSPSIAEIGDRLGGASGGWRVALGSWTALSLLSLVAWLTLYLATPAFRKRPVPTDASSSAGPSLWRSRTSVALMFFFGLQSCQAYIQFGWIPQVYRDGGLGSQTAALMLALIAVGGIPGGLLMPSIVARGRHLDRWVLTFSVALAVGYLGIGFMPTTLPWLWAVSLAFAGFCFPTALALIIERTRQPQTTARVSGFTQPVGYLLAAAGPFLVGVLHQWISSWTTIMIILALTSIPLAIAGLIAVRPRYVDDELTAKEAGAPRRLRGYPQLRTARPQERQDEVLHSILNGTLTSLTTPLYYRYAVEGEIPSSPGIRLVLDSEGKARGAVEVESVSILPLGEVSEKAMGGHAHGTPSAEEWKRSQIENWEGIEPHTGPFGGEGIDDNTQVVVETFHLTERLDTR